MLEGHTRTTGERMLEGRNTGTDVALLHAHQALAAAKDDMPEAPAPPAANMAVPAAPPPPPSDTQALLPANAAWVAGGLAPPASAGVGIAMGIKEGPPAASTPSPATLTPSPAAPGAGPGAALAALGGTGAVKKDKAAARPVKKGKKGAGEGEEPGGEALLGGEDVDPHRVDPLYALSVHAVSASAKEKAAKDALRTGSQEGAPDKPKDGASGKQEVLLCFSFVSFSLAHVHLAVASLLLAPSPPCALSSLCRVRASLSGSGACVRWR